jgi:hypothetical protein
MDKEAASPSRRVRREAERAEAADVDADAVAVAETAIRVPRVWTPNNSARTLLGLLLVLSSLESALGISGGGSDFGQHGLDRPWERPVATDWCVQWSGAQICDEFPFDSTRGYPGEGPSSPTSAENVFPGDGRNINSTGDSRELHPTSSSSNTNEPGQRREVGRGCAFTRGSVRNTRSGVLFHLPPDAVAATDASEIGSGLNAGGRGRDRSVVLHLQCDREVRGTRRRQMFTFVGQKLRAKNTPSGPMAQRAPRASDDIQCESKKLQRASRMFASKENGTRSASERLRERRVYDPQVRRGAPSLYGFSSTEQVQRKNEVSNGGRTGSGGDDSAWRLWHAGRSQRCLPHTRVTPIASKGLSISLPQDTGETPVEDGLLRDVGSPQDLHEDIAPTDRNTQVPGRTRCLIYIDGLLLLDQGPVRLSKAMAIAMELL